MQSRNITPLSLQCSLWCAFFTDFWKRRNAEAAYDWDVLDLHEDEPDRPQFKGLGTTVDPVSGKTIKVINHTS
jgi:hypothetical protein